jgi:hypothetical protein
MLKLVSKSQIFYESGIDEIYNDIDIIDHFSHVKQEGADYKESHSPFLSFWVKREDLWDRDFLCYYQHANFQRRLVLGKTPANLIPEMSGELGRSSLAWKDPNYIFTCPKQNPFPRH